MICGCRAKGNKCGEQVAKGKAADSCGEQTRLYTQPVGTHAFSASRKNVAIRRSYAMCKNVTSNNFERRRKTYHNCQLFFELSHR